MVWARQAEGCDARGGGRAQGKEDCAADVGGRGALVQGLIVTVCVWCLLVDKVIIIIIIIIIITSSCRPCQSGPKQPSGWPKPPLALLLTMTSDAALVFFRKLQLAVALASRGSCRAMHDAARNKRRKEI